MTTSRFTIPFDELSLDQVELVGGKSAHLGDLLRAGFPVPPGFAITALAFDRVSSRATTERRWRHREMPSEVASEIATAYAALGRRVGRDEPPVAVRSSAVAEDAADASFAGVQDTYLWLSGLEEVLRGVQRCWASYFNPEATAYRAQHTGARAGMSVAVQYMVDARVAGVMFTLNPVSGDPSSIAIDASYGLGTTVVGGEVTPDSYLVSKVTREVVRSVVGAKEIECVAAENGDGTTISVDADRRAQAVPRAGRDRVARRARASGRSPLRPSPGSRVGDRPPTRRGLPASEQAGDGVEPETPHAAGRRTRRALGDRRHLPPRLTEGEAAVSEGSELSPEDVKEILRLIDESEFDELELETPRFSLRFSRRGAGADTRADTGRALGPRGCAGSRRGHRLPRACPR